MMGRNFDEINFIVGRFDDRVPIATALQQDLLNKKEKSANNQDCFAVKKRHLGVINPKVPFLLYNKMLC
jgi:hypothetical protein